MFDMVKQDGVGVFNSIDRGNQDMVHQSLDANHVGAYDLEEVDPAKKKYIKQVDAFHEMLAKHGRKPDGTDMKSNKSVPNSRRNNNRLV